MKKIIFILGICLLCAAIFAAGCLGGNNSSDNSSSNELPNLGNPVIINAPPNSANSSNNTSSSSNNSSNNASLQIAPPITPPTNTTMFFGRVTDIQKVYGMPVIVLSNSEGQNFIFSNQSQTNFNLSDLPTRPYLKVYVDTPVIVPSPDSIPVVVANIIDIARLDGEVVNVTPSSPESFSDIQSIEVKSWDNGSSMIFHCNETPFGIALKDIKIGETVSVVYDKNTVTVLENMPPQAKAYEFYYVSRIVCY
jgi:hypothetical protein